MSIVIPTPLQKSLIAQGIRANVYFEDEEREFSDIKIPLPNGLTAYVTMTVFCEFSYEPESYSTPSSNDLSKFHFEISDAWLENEDCDQYDLILNAKELEYLQ